MRVAVDRVLDQDVGEHVRVPPQSHSPGAAVIDVRHQQAADVPGVGLDVLVSGQRPFARLPVHALDEVVGAQGKQREVKLLPLLRQASIYPGDYATRKVPLCRVGTNQSDSSAYLRRTPAFMVSNEKLAQLGPLVRPQATARTPSSPTFLRLHQARKASASADQVLVSAQNHCLRPRWPIPLGV